MFCKITPPILPRIFPETILAEAAFRKGNTFKVPPDWAVFVSFGKTAWLIILKVDQHAMNVSWFTLMALDLAISTQIVGTWTALLLISAKNSKGSCPFRIQKEDLHLPHGEHLTSSAVYFIRGNMFNLHRFEKLSDVTHIRNWATKEWEQTS